MISKELIESMELTLAKLKVEYAEQEEFSYRQQKHKDFTKGDYVTNGDIIGTVEWVENNGIGVKAEDGKMGVNIVNGNLGFIAPVRRDDYWALDDIIETFYVREHVVKFKATGKDINNFLYRMHYNVNPFDGQTALLASINTIKAKYHETPA